ncbi:calcium-binding protein [Aestuariicoccus sp. MJ-SS9]|uniref:calcium-binding protein n=1 Tax=Aestuariicoccus sp. MJ-SS9 TaxID=3079855 RepID=UPI0029151E97|nr:VCBS domain-containing protein [Aestuariicoccus sp. MJ-SS9]MDU8912824.1 VCBS domain-containing protein [Aestuariicoccus sp. MJ-SS9]
MPPNLRLFHSANGNGHDIDDMVDFGAEFLRTLIVTGKGDDTVIGGAARDKIQTGKDDDEAWGGDGNDLIRGGKGLDFLNGEAGRDRIWGGQGADTIDGGAGNDTILGGLGHDLLTGGGGHDRIFAGKGNDVIAGGTGDDTIRGGAGDDTVVFEGSVFDFDITAAGGGWTFVEDLSGTGGRDKLRGVEVLQFDDATVTLSGGNAPLVLAEPVTALAGEVTVFDIRAFDFDGDAMSLDALSVSGPGSVSAGAAVLDATGGTVFQLSFDTEGGYRSLGVGADAVETVTVTVRDDGGSETQVQLALTVMGVNDAPVIDAVTGLGDVLNPDAQTTASGSVLASDPDTGDTLSYAVEGGGNGDFGTLSVGAGGAWSYTLDPGADIPLDGGEDTFVFVVSDQHGARDTQSVSFDVTAPAPEPEPEPEPAPEPVPEPALVPEATLLTFEDLSDDTTHRFAVPEGYGGLDWSEWALIMETDEHTGTGTGYVTGAVSGDNIVYNSYSRDLTISRDTPFDLESASVTAAVRDGLVLTVTGFLDGAETGAIDIALSRSTPTPVEFDDAIFDAVDAVTFSTNFNSLGQFAMDDLLYIG